MDENTRRATACIGEVDIITVTLIEGLDDFVKLGLER